MTKKVLRRKIADLRSRVSDLTRQLDREPLTNDGAVFALQLTVGFIERDAEKLGIELNTEHERLRKTVVECIACNETFDGYSWPTVIKAQGRDPRICPECKAHNSFVRV